MISASLRFCRDLLFYAGFRSHSYLGTRGLVGLGTLAFFSVAATATDARSEVSRPQSHATIDEGSIPTLARAFADGRAHVPVVVVSRIDRLEDVSVSVRSIGGRIIRALPEIDTIFAIVPTEVVSRLQLIKNVQAISIDRTHLNEIGQQETIWYASELSGKIEENQDASFRAPLVDPTAFSIMDELNGTRLRREYAGDGRGVVIAHVETFPDFLVPQLSQGLDKDGRTVQKYLDVINIPPLAEGFRPDGDADWQWIALEPLANAVRRGAMPQLVRLPQGKSFEVGFIRLPPSARRLINLPRGTEVDPIPVLWSRDRRAAWIDADRDGDFAEEMPVEEFRISQEFGVLGTDDPNTLLRESLGFALQYDERSNSLSLNLGMSSHATFVAGAAAASGTISGVAPGAQFIVINSGETIANTILAYVAAFADRRTDLVLVENRGSLTTPHQKDGTAVLSIVLERLVERFNKPGLVTAGNAVGLSTVDSNGAASSILTIGAAQTRAGLLAHYRVIADRDINVSLGSSEGPTLDGRIKPDLLSPETLLSTTVLFEESSGPANRPPLPHGQHICSGTSCATPTAAGGLAILIGMARDAQITVNAKTLTEALRFGARFIQGTPAHQQGFGIIDLEGAWRILNSPTQSISINSGLTEASLRPGGGIYERDGGRVGSTRELSVLLRRETGELEDIEFEVVVLGDGAAFTVPDTVTLPRNVVVRLPLSALTPNPGSYSVIVQLWRSGRLHAAFPVILVTPTELTPENGYSASLRGTVSQLGRTSFFIRVPEGADALKIDVSLREPWIWTRVHPPSGRRLTYPMAPNPVTGVETTSFPNPEAGTWEIVLNDGAAIREHDWHEEPQLGSPVPVAIEASIISAETSLVSQNQVALSNRLAPLGDPYVVALPGQLLTWDSVIQRFGVHAFSIDVPPQATLLSVSAASNTDHGGGDILLYNCSTGECRPTRYALSMNLAESISIERPAAGLWRAIFLRKDSVMCPISVRFRTFVGSRDGNAAVLANAPQSTAETTQGPLAKSPAALGSAIMLYVRDDSVRSKHLPGVFPWGPLPYGSNNMHREAIPLGQHVIGAMPPLPKSNEGCASADH